MIQRIQTIYLSIAIILLAVVSFGTEVVSFVGESSKFTFNSYGITEYSLANNSAVDMTSYPFYLSLIALVLLCVACILSYKNLARQFRLGRIIFGIYFLLVVAVTLLCVFGDSMIDEKIVSREMGLGYFLLVAGFPFTFLANTGIKRDKRLLDSLDRLR